MAVKNILIKNEFSENITNRINEKYITKNDMENIYLFRTNIERKRRVRQITTTSEKKKGRKKMEMNLLDSIQSKTVIILLKNVNPYFLQI